MIYLLYHNNDKTYKDQKANLKVAAILGRFQLRAPHDTLLSLRDAGDQLPAAAFLLSPLGDLINFDGESYKSRAKVDPFYNNNESSHTMSDYYIDNLTVKPLILSPIKQNLAGLPSLLIQVGDHEVLLNDSTRLAEYARAAGVDVTLEIWPNMWHVFQGFASIMPEAKQAVDKIGEFIRKHLD